MSAHSPQLDRIDEAIGILKRAFEILAPATGVQHVPYALRAANELALAYLRRARAVPPAEQESHLAEAEQYLRWVKASQTITDDKRTYCASLVAESRIQRERGDYPRALEVAQKAKDYAGGMKFSRIDAFIAIGEASFQLGSYGDAADAFEHALGIGSTTRKLAAVCHLHLCRTYLADDQPSKAIDHFNRWEALQFRAENAFIADLANKVSKQMAQILGDFRIRSDVVDLTADIYIVRLRKWLARTALSRTNDNYARAAMLLGIGEGALRLWLKKGMDP